MATQSSRSAARVMIAPAVILLLGWMLVPLLMTLYFSFKRYLPLRGGDLGWIGFDNYVRFVTSSAFWPSVQATLIIVGGVLLITVVFGILLAGKESFASSSSRPSLSCRRCRRWCGRTCSWIP
jgi:sorbitol/mannitol transport system permease protein